MDISDDDRLAERRERDLAVQQVVDGLVEEGPHQDAGVVADRLVRGLAEAGVMGMPQAWLDAVVREVMEGNAYVVSSFSEDRADVPPPQHGPPTEIID